MPGLGLEVEYELHAMKELLPRRLFRKDEGLFRMDETGQRNPDANLCVHSQAALEIAAENAVAIARTLRPTTGRYFYWGDDGKPWCRCPECEGLSDSDQATLLENHLLRALRGHDPRASLAHLAYLNSLSPPAKVKPEPGVFLEYAPIKRRYDTPYEKQSDPGQPDGLSALDANLAGVPGGHGAGPGVLAGRVEVLAVEAARRAAAVAAGRAGGRPGDLCGPWHPARHQLRRLRRCRLPQAVRRAGVHPGVREALSGSGSGVDRPGRIDLGSSAPLHHGKKPLRKLASDPS